jgi:hypothetical protein
VDVAGGVDDELLPPQFTNSNAVMIDKSRTTILAGFFMK